ncbi:unnamed protein product [Clonostachys solani]|uniref:Uncharacterized protein n=1 Tax=Clonostachys solani TaxID=160281 RepID=A0A9N9W7E2_9HYPO|nr:unnamed protein product [Clonostachys solani]
MPKDDLMASVFGQENSQYKNDCAVGKTIHELAHMFAVTEQERSKLLRFARAGGPDLTDLRGYYIKTGEPSYYLDYEESTSEMGIPEKPPRRPSGASKPDFLRKCIRYNIYPRTHTTPKRNYSPRPQNIDSILEMLRPKPGDHLVGDAEFKNFESAAAHATSQAYVMGHLVTMLLGGRGFKSMENVPFLNLDSMTDGELSAPQPDLCDGVQPETVEDSVRDDLETIIAPSEESESPLVTNFFLQAEGPQGTINVAQKQVTLDGAYGSRMMHALQNFGKGTPEYDENAYTFSATYIEGILSLFAHHVAAPTIHTKGHPGYHITLLRGFVLHDELAFADGIYALRALRQLARTYREEFIEIANERADNMPRLQEEHEPTVQPAAEADAGRDRTNEMPSRSGGDDDNEGD